MRTFVLSCFVIVAVIVPKVGSAQGSSHRIAPPVVNAAAADWQLNSEPIIVSSTLFQATRATRMFDGQVMVQVGVYQRVPVYADVTLEPNSVVYVPVARQSAARLRAAPRPRPRARPPAVVRRRFPLRVRRAPRQRSGRWARPALSCRRGWGRRMPCRMRHAR